MRATTEREVVCRTGLVTVGLFRARPGDPEFRDSGPIDNDIVVFPRTSVRITHEGREPVVANPNVVIFYNKGQEYRRDKVSDRGDVCEWFAFPRDMLEEVLSRHGDRPASRRRGPFRLTHAPSDPSSFLIQRMVVEHILEHPEPDRLLVEEALIGVLDRVVARAHRERPAGSASDRRLARELAAFLALGFREKLTLKRIAGSFGYSPFQLCRIFRRQTGTTIHRYLNQIRLRTALDHVVEGHDDLARLGLELGYSSHSHFTSSFRRAFGAPPSRIRRLRSPGQLRKMRKILTG